MGQIFSQHFHFFPQRRDFCFAIGRSWVKYLVQYNLAIIELFSCICLSGFGSNSAQKTTSQEKEKAWFHLDKIGSFGIRKAVKHSTPLGDSGDTQWWSDCYVGKVSLCNVDPGFLIVYKQELQALLNCFFICQLNSRGSLGKNRPEFRVVILKPQSVPYDLLIFSCFREFSIDPEWRPVIIVDT